ncbi:MAG: hypothetical protein O7G88_02545 [bacterium]|nr:hypothetical protein [bacterium]
MNRSMLLELDSYTDYERRLNTLTRTTEDAEEGCQAFCGKRVPRLIRRYKTI